MDVKSLADRSLDDALKFYERWNVPLSYRPTISIRDEPCEMMPGAIACVRDEFDATRIFQRFAQAGLARAGWHRLGLRFSDATIEEGMRISGELVKNNLQLPSYLKEADIIVFPSFKQEHLPPAQVMAHEVWHLIERERQVFDGYELIVEGTARFAEHFFAGKTCERHPKTCNDFNSLRYDGAAFIVAAHASYQTNPLQTILNRVVRERIQECFNNTSLDQFLELATQMSKRPEARKMMAALYERIPPLKKLRGNLTANGLIEAYRELGWEGGAREMAGQDLSKFMEHLREFGF